MHIEKTKLKDLIILKSEVYKDNRGFFKEINKTKILKKNLDKCHKQWVDGLGITTFGSTVFNPTNFQRDGSDICERK